MRSLVLGLALGLIASACGSSEDEGDASGGPSATPVDAESFPALYAEHFCAAQQPCCSAAGGERSATCVADVESAVAELIESQAALPNQEFSVERAQACVDALQGVTTCEWDAIITACGRIIVGTLPGGAACENAGECAPPAAGYAGCAELGGGTEKRCRQFQATATEGEDCFDAQSDPFGGDEGEVVVCAQGFYCLAGVCAAGGSLGEACQNSSQCAEGFCFDDTCQQPALGESCTTDGAPCEYAASCEAGACVQRPLLEQIANAETCTL